MKYSQAEKGHDIIYLGKKEIFFRFVSSKQKKTGTLTAVSLDALRLGDVLLEIICVPNISWNIPNVPSYLTPVKFLGTVFTILM
jgi:hypothetical protein